MLRKNIFLVLKFALIMCVFLINTSGIQAYLQPPSQTYMNASGLPQYIPFNECDFFVAKNGNNSNSGLSEGQALATIDEGIKKVVAGKTLCIKGGTYTSVTINKSGTQSQPLTIGGYEPNSAVIIDGANYTKSGLTISNNDYIDVIAMEVTKAKKTAAVTISDSDNINLVNLNVHHNLGNGLNVKGGSKVRIEHSDFWYNIMDRKLTGEIGGGAIQVHTSREGALRWNRVYRNFGEGINIGRDANMILVESNQAWENDHTAYYINRASNILFHKNLMICTGDKSSWHTAEGIPGKKDSTGKAFTFVNEDSKPTTRILCPYDGGGNNALINNISIGCTTHFHMGMQDDNVCPAQHGKTLVAHNTFIDARKDQTADAKTPDFFDIGTDNNPYSDTVMIINNLIVQDDPSSRMFAKPSVVNMPNFTVSNNYTNRTPNVSTGFVVTNLPFVSQYNQNNLQKPPNVDPSMNRLQTNIDYARITSNSPAVNSGAGISGFGMFNSYLATDFFGTNRVGNSDIGAHESNGTQPPLPSSSPSTSPVPSASPTGWDLNNDGKINAYDFVKLVKGIGSEYALPQVTQLLHQIFD